MTGLWLLLPGNLAGLPASPCTKHHMDLRHRTMNVRQLARPMCAELRGCKGFDPVPVGLHHRVVSELEWECSGGNGPLHSLMVRGLQIHA